MDIKYPIKVIFLDDGEEWILDNEKEVACNLEWFDSRNSDENAVVFDKEGNELILVVEKLEIKEFKMK